MIPHYTVCPLFIKELKKTQFLKSKFDGKSTVYSLYISNKKGYIGHMAILRPPLFYYNHVKVFIF